MINEKHIRDVPLGEKSIRNQLNIFKFKLLIEIYKTIVTTYDDYNEQYKWKLITDYKDKLNVDSKDFLTNFKKIYNNNLSSTQAKTNLNDLINQHFEEYKEILRELFDENIDLSERMILFKENSNKILNKQNSNQDERLASVLLTVKNPQKYTFYKKEGVYDELCNWFNIELAKPNYRYSHYLEILNLLTQYIDEDKELKDINHQLTKIIDNCYYSNKLLIQDILYISFSWIEKGVQFYLAPYTKKFDFNEKKLFQLKIISKKILGIGDVVFLFSNDLNYITDICVSIIDVNKVLIKKVFELEPNEYLSLEKLKEQGFTEKNININLLNEKTTEYIFKVLNTNYELQGVPQMQNATYTKHTDLINLLKANHNLIFHGAPGTGKTFTAKEMAAQMIFGKVIKEDEMTESEKKQWNEQFGFVQFHPSYDYTDFVEGLRPNDENKQNVSGFKRIDGVFKKFCEQAAKNLIDSKKSKEELEKELSAEESLNSFLDEALNNSDMKFHTLTGNEFYISVVEEDYCEVYIPENPQIKNLRINKNELLELLKGDVKLETVKDITRFFNKNHATQHYSYEFIIVNEILKQKKTSTIKSETITRKNFIFLIDEINRGETSKIFGELFFSIDPGYRGIAGRITTQYQNLVEGGEFSKGFYVPENVYIIGTMNDIDRGVETMDFAFRRRFAWKEIKAIDTQNMLDSLINDNGITEETINLAKAKMNAINQKIAVTSDLDESYQIGAAYFMKLSQYGGDFEALWNYHIKGLITEYLRGQGDLEKLVAEFKAVYDGTDTNEFKE